jgi:signal transduction histidine kinase
MSSSPVLPVTWQRGEYGTFLVVIAVCAIAALWSTLRDGGGLSDSLITTNSIGLTQYSIAMLIRIFFRGRLPVLGIVLAIPAGFLLGSKIAGLAGGTDVASLMMADPVSMRRTILTAILIGVVVTAFFLYFSHSRGVREALERERLRAAEALQAETEARLAQLQAQIEPHFLFNTLANIRSLIREDPDAASLILEKLDTCLRTSLRRSRNLSATVGKELELIEALLAIAHARLGARLAYAISDASGLRAIALPPLLLQPLVENAIKHGIEPAIAGGRIDVRVERRGDEIELTVADTGIGLDPNAPEGVGLANIRARLESLYGERGRLSLYANSPSGVLAKLRIPWPKAPT